MKIGVNDVATKNNFVYENWCECEGTLYLIK